MRFESELARTPDAVDNRWPILTDSVVEAHALDYGARTCRPVLPLEAWRDVAGSATGVLVMGAPSSLNSGLVTSMVERESEATLGFATARTPDALSRFLDRQRAPRRGSAMPDLLIDELHDRAVQCELDARLTDMNFPHHDVRGLLTKERRVLALHAHGEGAHANLRNTVLCGADGSGGLHRGDCSPEFCKRSSRASEPPVAFSQLAAQTLIYLSCNGFAVAGDNYPTNVSAILSAVEGNIRTLVCNDRTIPLDDQEVELAFLVAISKGPVAAVELLNSISGERASGAKPWFIVGDPQAVVNDVSSEQTFETYDVPLAHTMTVEADPRPRVMVRVGAQVLVRRDAAAPDVTADQSTRLDFVDFEAALAQFEQDLQDRAAFVLAVEGLVDACQDRLFGGKRSPLLDELALGTSTMRRGLARSKRRINALRRRGVNATGALDWGPLDRLTSAWSRMAAKSLLEVADLAVEECVLELSDVVYRFSETRCDRCGSRLRLGTGVHWGSSAVQIEAESCSQCGIRRVSLGKVKLLSLSYASSWKAGEPATFGIGVAGAQQHVAFSLRDKATGKNLIRMAPVVGDEDVSVALPSTASCDLHTARVIVVGAAGLTIERRRLAFVDEAR